MHWSFGVMDLSELAPSAVLFRHVTLDTLFPAPECLPRTSRASDSSLLGSRSDDPLPEGSPS